MIEREGGAAGGVYTRVAKGRSKKIWFGFDLTAPAPPRLGGHQGLRWPSIDSLFVDGEQNINYINVFLIIHCMGPGPAYARALKPVMAPDSWAGQLQGGPGLLWAAT